MDDNPTAGRLKRSLPVDDDDSENKYPPQKRVRFPKGKKIKPGDEAVQVQPKTEDVPSDVNDPQLAAKERALRRNQNNAKLLLDENVGTVHNISAAEVQYEDNETFVDDGIQIEPFNLSKEREEGYFDASGNYVEYINEKDIKDAWLDSVDDGPKFAGKSTILTSNEEQVAELSSKDIGKMKRRIANALESGETVLRALRRLKGNSNNRKEKMSEETKAIFDQLTEDAMKLMENGDYNVYDEKKEVFEREAVGYEKLAQARGEGGTSTNDDDDVDMFAEEDENPNATLASDGGNHENVSSESGTIQVQDSYVYDESSGYYYSSTLGYYYDPSSGLYCYAATGQWYSYNSDTGSYDEVEGYASNTGSYNEIQGTASNSS